MKTETFNSIIESQIKRSTEVQGTTPIQALAGMMCKHTVSVYDMCRSGEYPIELWSKKITDSINYLLLLRAMVEEIG